MKQAADKEHLGMLQKFWKSITTGDRVIWIILILLLLISVVAIFSSTSTMAIKHHTTRVAIFWGHLKFVGVGLGIVLFMHAFPNLRAFRFMGSLGFAGSLALLLMLVGKIKIGNLVYVEETNEACRAITVGHFNLAVYEVVKVAMVMYLAWAVQTYECAGFKSANYLCTRYPGVFGWLGSERAQRWVYIFIPIMVVTVLIFFGSTGSALMIGTVMFFTIIIGGIKFKHLVEMGAVSAVGLALLLTLHIVSSGKIVPRMQTAFNRFSIELPYLDKEAREKQVQKIAIKKADPEDLKPGTKEFNRYKDLILQPKSAEIALVQGAKLPIGKGPGKSTQKYIVPVMFADYMYSFLVEEYGLLMGLFILWMYMELFARGMIISCSCDNRFGKAVVGGLAFLITFQAMFHILVNCAVGVVTGQTLPMISHGRCSFLCFSLAFGVILSISAQVNKKIEKERKKELELAQMDEIQSSVAMTEDIDMMNNDITEDESYN